MVHKGSILKEKNILISESVYATYANPHTFSD